MAGKTKSLAQWIDDNGKQRLVKAVAQAEQRTAAEIVVMVSGKASSVDHIPTLIFTVVGLIASLGALAHLHVPLGVSLQLFLLAGLVLALVVSWLGGRHPSIQRLLTTPSERERQVAERAELEFYRKGLMATRGRTGVLVFVSLMEHRIHILTDKAIASLVSETTWSGGVTAILDGIRKNDLVAGLEHALALMTPVLAEVAPAQGDNPNELSDHVILIPS